MEISLGTLRWLVLLAGVVLLAIGWFSNDEGMARHDRRQRWNKAAAEKEGWTVDALESDRESSGSEFISGGFTRMKFLFFGAVLTLVGIFWIVLG